MKKTRIVSWLLTASLAMSCLPVMATSVAAADTESAKDAVDSVVLNETFERREPRIYTDKIVGYATMEEAVAAAGWYPKSTNNATTTISYESEKLNGIDNEYLHVSNITSAGDNRGVFYNTGIILEPGVYHLSIDLRLNDPAAQATGYVLQKMRVNLTDYKKPTDPHYSFANGKDPVDLHTYFNDSNQVVGWQFDVTPEWNTFTDTIVIDKVTPMIIRIYGYTDSKWSKNFDIDNLIVVQDNMIENGEFTDDIAIYGPNNLYTKNTFDETFPAWMIAANKGGRTYSNYQKYFLYENGADYKFPECLVQKDMLIERMDDSTSDGYISFSNFMTQEQVQAKKAELKSPSSANANQWEVLYHTGITMEAGKTYNISTVVRAESAVLRFYVDFDTTGDGRYISSGEFTNASLYTDFTTGFDGSSSTAGVSLKNNEWKLVSFEYTCSHAYAGKELVIGITGGTSPDHAKPFDVEEVRVFNYDDAARKAAAIVEENIEKYNAGKSSTTVVSALDAGNFVITANGATEAVSANATVTKAENTTNKFLQVYNRKNNGDGVTVQANGLPAGDYVLSFDIRQSTDVAQANSLNFTDPAVSTNADANRVTGGNATYYFDFKADGSWKTINYPFKSTGGKNELYIWGGQAQTFSNPIDIDRMVITNSAGAVFWTEDFNTREAGALGSSFTYQLNAKNGGTVKVFQRFSHGVAYAIAEDTDIISIDASDLSTITYTEPETTLLPGTYTIRGSIRNGYYNGNGAGRSQLNYIKADMNAHYLLWYYKDKGATLEGTGDPVFGDYKFPLNIIVVNNNNFDVTISADINGETVAHEANITSGWTDFEFAFTVEREMPMPVINFTVDHAMPYTIGSKSGIVPVDFKNFTMEFTPADEEVVDAINPGILLVLLMLKKNAQAEENVTTETVQYIENGDFEKPVTIKEGAIFNNPTADDAGWYAKMSKSGKLTDTTIKQITDGGNTFLRVSDLDTDQRGVYYNTGLVLKPGTYTVEADMRISETSADANYSAKTWRDGNVNKMQVRINAQNPATPTSPHYAQFNSVDKDCYMDVNGNAVGTLTMISREWTHYTDTLVLDRDTLLIFKIGGGTGGQVDSHGFDIDNLSVTQIVKKDENGEIIVPEENKFVSLIPNGDFATEPKTDEGTYNASVSGVWFRHSGMDYKYDANGKAITTEPKIMHEMKLTYKDGYMTLSGREFNMKPVSINPGIVLQPGTYKFSIDFKTAVAGEKTVNRVYITSADGKTSLFNPGTANVAQVTDTWSTFTCEFTVSANTDIKIELKGGPGQSFKQSYCFDNLVLEKIS